MSAEKAQPTAGALRAADIIVSNIATYNELRNIEILQPPIDKVAECIDRETSVPELREALQAIVDCYGLGLTPEKFAQQVSGLIDDAHAALKGATFSRAKGE